MIHLALPHRQFLEGRGIQNPVDGLFQVAPDIADNTRFAAAAYLRVGNAICRGNWAVQKPEHLTEVNVLG